jgi:hypothetical protein
LTEMRFCRRRRKKANSGPGDDVSFRNRTVVADHIEGIGAPLGSK